MRTIDNERAEYIDNGLNRYLERFIRRNIDRYSDRYSILFFARTKRNALRNSYRDGIEELKRIFRRLYVIHRLPIKRYLSQPTLSKNIL